MPLDDQVTEQTKFLQTVSTGLVFVIISMTFGNQMCIFFDSSTARSGGIDCRLVKNWRPSFERDQQGGRAEAVVGVGLDRGSGVSAGLKALQRADGWTDRAEN